MVGFNVGDKVFAKVKGWPAWPARVTSINGKKYGVEFYGTNETGTLKQEDLFYYLSNKHKIQKKQKRKFYAEAIIDIELDIDSCGGSDGNPNASNDNQSEPTPQQSNTTTKGNKRKRNSINKKAAPGNDAKSKRLKLDAELAEEKSVDNNNINVPESTESQELTSGNSQGTGNSETSSQSESNIDKKQGTLDNFVAKSEKTEETKLTLENNEDKFENPTENNEKHNENDEKQREDVKQIENHEKPTENGAEKTEMLVQNGNSHDIDSKSLKFDETNTEKIEEINSIDFRPETKENSEVNHEENAENLEQTSEIITIEEKVEKLEENPYYTGELNGKDINILPEFYFTAISIYAERVQDNSHYYKINKPDPVSLDDATDTRLKVLPVKLSANKYCGLIYAPQPLENFKSEFDRAMDDAKIVQELLDLKAKIDAGNHNIHDHRFIKSLNCTDDYVQTTTNLTIVGYKKAKLNWLQRGMDAYKHLIEIKRCLRFNEANTKQALIHMESLLYATFDVVSLKKHADVVDTIIGLSKYVGNRKDWTLTEAEGVEFEADAFKIRQMADNILDKIRSLFDYGRNADQFMDNFEKDCKVFNEATKHMNEAEVFSLCGEPLSRKAQLELIFDEQADVEWTDLSIDTSD